MKNVFYLICLITILISCNKKTTEPTVNTKPTNLDVFKVRVAPVNGLELNNLIRVTGILVSDQESKPAFKTGGVIERTYYKEGDKVTKGALLARLNLAEIQAQVQQAQMAVDKANRDLNRVKNLYADSVATLEQLQNVQTAYDMAKQNLTIAEFNKTYSEVRSPISGIVIKEILRQGEIAGPGMAVYAIMGTGQQDWEIKAAVSDKEWARIKKGDKADIYFEAYPGLQLIGVINHIADMSNPGTATLDIEIKLNQQDKKLAAGLLATVEIKTTGSKQALLSIPVEALVSSNDGIGVIFIIQDGKAIKKKISIDKILGDQVAVGSGLENITQVITAGAIYLEDGDKVEIIK